MIFYLNSRELVDYFLPYEKDKDILESQYVLVSSRILKRDAELENIVSAKSILYPNPEAFSASTDDKFYRLYYKQLSKQVVFFASVIKETIENNNQIIFLCTEKESRTGLFSVMEQYVWEEFSYPIYSYTEYTSNCELKDYDEKKVLKYCNKLLDKAHKKSVFQNGNEKEQSKYFKKKSKKELKKMLKKENLYYDGMDKEEMIETIELYKDLFV